MSTLVAKDTETVGSPRPVKATDALLACGALAGPLFLAAVFIQFASRPGLDPARHPLSLLSLGDHGWIQITNFILAGALITTSAVGMRRKLRGEPAGTWGPILFGFYGVAMIWGGVFTADPAFGYPTGTPNTAPATFTVHGILHSVAAPLMGIALVAACLVFARRDHHRKQRGLAITSWACAGAYIALFAAAMATGNYWFMLASGSLIFLWAAGITAHVYMIRHTTR